MITVFRIVHELGGLPFETLFTLIFTAQSLEVMDTSCLRNSVISIFGNLASVNKLLRIAYTFN